MFATTSVLAAAATYDLTDLATARDELSIAANDTTNDSWLGRAISQVSRAIAAYANRVLAAELVQDSFDVQSDACSWQTRAAIAPLQLSRWPVLTVMSVAVGGGPALVEGVDFRVDAQTGQLLRLGAFTGAATSWEAAPIAVQYAAGYGALVVESHAVPAVAPLQLTVAQAAAFSCDVTVNYASGLPLIRVAGTPTPGCYTVAAGVYLFNPADAGRALTFSYAVKAIPADLVMVALRLVSDRFSGKDRDPNLVEEETPGMGRRRYWFGNTPGQSGPFAPDIAATLDPYRVPVVL